MAKKFDPKAKAKRQKIIAAVGGVILLGLLAFQVPRTMKMLHPSSAASDTSSASATTTATTAATASGTTAPAASTGGDGLADSDGVPAPASGQLLAFGRFRTKDPFAQQLVAGATGATGPTAASPAQPKSSSSTPTTVPGSTKPAVQPVVRTVASSAVISVDGSAQRVPVDRTFPSANPVFKLVAVTANTAKVGIAGGSFESGAATVTLTKNKPVTLLNTANGTRYVLRLLSVS